MAACSMRLVFICGIIGILSALEGDNICTRSVAQKVSYIETRRVSSRKCSTPNDCRTVYSLQKVLKFRITNAVQRFCCPGFIQEGNRCVLITTPAPSTTLAPTTTQTSTTTNPDDVIDPNPIEGALEEADGNGGALSEGAVIGVVLAVIFVMAAALVGLMLKIRKNKKQDKEAIIQSEMYRGQSIHENGLDPDQNSGGAFENDLYNLTNNPPKGDTSTPDMYDQLHLYGNAADEASHDYERPVRSKTIGGGAGEYYSKAMLPNPSFKSEGHQTVKYQNKGDVSGKVRVFERLASNQSDDQTFGNKMLYSDVRY
ncbi:uncharacterized protein LOC133180816 [Saccostrea echinata]|uniref:uncharacterized protein LOC133180816 n=1 Tax=Saccostrea echinata TaxID=191078 RepID=UPI002A7F1A0F|nr:uncharacterized protein LOC133180816 [Saccostrea echinata]